MDKYRILLSQNAKDDIIEIHNYITYVLLSPDISHKFFKGLRKSISQLSFFPYKFPLVRNKLFKNMEYHYMPYKNYLVFYEVIEKQNCVNVLRIVYKKRNWNNSI